MERNEWNAGQLLGVSGSYWQACALHAGIKLDVFTRIGSDELSADEIASGLDCDLRGTTVILNALAAMGHPIKRQDQYSNSASSKSLLVRESPNYIGYMIMHHHNLVEAWAGLDRAVKSGRPVRSSAARKEEERESFLMGMFNMAMGIAPQVADQIDLSGRRALLDLGGGPGTYAIHFCLANPDLEATVFDLPYTRPFATKTIEKFGLADRIDFMAGDYLEDQIKGPYDVAWLSHILHSEGPGACQVIIDKSVAAMSRGGLLLIHDFLLSDNLDSPLFPALFSLNMLIGTRDGRSYSENQIREMLERAGVRNIRRFPFQGPNESGIISGEI